MWRSIAGVICVLALVAAPNISMACDEQVLLHDLRLCRTTSNAKSWLAAVHSCEQAAKASGTCSADAKRTDAIRSWRYQEYKAFYLMIAANMALQGSVVLPFPHLYAVAERDFLLSREIDETIIRSDDAPAPVQHDAQTDLDMLERISRK
jgi:hypothetical protein